MIVSFCAQIADFGMSRDLMDDNYYVAHGGHQIPVRWTAPEVRNPLESTPEQTGFHCLLE